MAAINVCALVCSVDQAPLYQPCFFLHRPVRMERESPERESPDSPPPDLDRTTNDHHTPDHRSSPPMSVAVASGIVPNMPGPIGGVNKRYRPAPAKTFQCRGYGDCRMVFSRSEHLARHIRKHTGERPFTCHCGKQFSRLDNLRQHAQTVHADKQDQNERMMRDLTSLHATMAAANKAGHPRSSRRTSATSAGHHSTIPSNEVNGMGIIKQEELSVGMHQRPDTSTGYEGDHNAIVYQTSANWHIQTSNMDPPRPSSRTATNTNAASNGGSHSFRDSTQSFLVPPASASASATSASTQSFLAFSSPLGFSLSPDPSTRPTSSSRPPTAGADSSQPRSLPPLASVVSASLSSPPSHQQLYPSPPSATSQSSQQHVLPFPPPPSHIRRPGTSGSRPGTAPASSALYHPSLSPGAAATPAKSSYYGGPGMAGPRVEQLQLHYGRAYPADLASGPGGYDSPTSAPESSDASPFFFQPPDASASPPLLHNTARSYPPPPPPASSGAGEYDYGSDSRPQSRRLSVMELCNDDTNGASAGVSAGAFLLSGPGGTAGPSRPNTSSGALAALALNDRERSPSSSPSTVSSRTGAGEVRAYAARAAPSGGRGTSQEFPAGNGYGYGYATAPGGRVSPAHRRVSASPTEPTLTATGAVFRGYPTTHSPSPAPYPQQQPSPQPYSPAGAYGGFAPSPTFSTASAGSSAASSAYGGGGGGGSPYSPRSPSYVPQSPAPGYGQQDIQYGHVHGDGQVRGGVRVGGHGHGHGHHASGPYGMRV